MEARPLVSCQRDEDALRISLGGVWRMDAKHPADLSGVFFALADSRITRVVYEIRDMEHWDTSLLVFVVQMERTVGAYGLASSRDALPEGLQRLVNIALAVPPGTAREHREEDSFLVDLGKRTMGAPTLLADVLNFQGALVMALWRLIRRKSDMRLKDLLDVALECGLYTLPLIMMTSTLFGMILAFVGSVQLAQFEAQIYVAGLVGISMLRLMGAILVGVLMSGRTGAAYAALIGTMQVNEEVDALITFGISPMDYLVLPRVLAMSVMLPLLTLYADLMGVVGGFLVGVIVLELPPGAYYNATVSMVGLRHVFVGLAYAASFGIIVGWCGCYQGIRCGRSAEAVGKATTSAVVSSIICIILATSIITVLCGMLQV